MNFSIPEEKEIRTAFAEGEEAVVALFGSITAQVEKLAAQLEKQAGMLKDLQARLSKNSRNSGKPPSSDGYGKKNKTESLGKSRTADNRVMKGELLSGRKTQIIRKRIPPTHVRTARHRLRTSSPLERKNDRFMIFRRYESKSPRIVRKS